MYSKLMTKEGYLIQGRIKANDGVMIAQLRTKLL